MIKASFLFFFLFFISLTFNPSCKSKNNLKDGIVGYWSFDDCTATDNSFNGYNGEIEGDLQCVFGIKNKAFKFSGEDGEGITIKHIPMMRDFTISFCFKINSLDNEFNNVLAFEPPNDELNFQFKKDNYKLRVEKKNLNTGLVITPDLEQNKFYCFSMVNDTGNNKQQFYLNGKLIKEIDTADYFNFTQLKIGYENVFNFNFNGIIDEIYLYNRPLSKNEIKALHTGILNK